MLTVRVGKTKMARRPNFSAKFLLKYMLVLVSAVVLLTLLLQKYNIPFKAGACNMARDCPEDHFSFFVRSGAANVVAPKICLQHKLVLGTVLNNAGLGINIVIINGKTGDVVKTAHFDMYSGDVKPLVEFLKSIETGAVVLMASYDEPSSKLDEEARKLIAELGSQSVKSLGFRDNWVFVGGKGVSVHSNFEKYLKNNNAKNKYENWPELIEIQGCIPKYLE
ncbi:protein FAM3C isoform X3 [Sander vitreus]